jgi:dihydroxy-acid dehydratase
MKKRKKAFKPRPQEIKSGYLARYARLVTSASTGAVFKD